jgi:hypothetical protein
MKKRIPSPEEHHEGRILQVINENFIEIILDMVNKMYRRHSRNSNRISKLQNMRKHKDK